MKVRKIVLMAIRGNTGLRRRIKEILGISDPTLYRLLTDEKYAKADDLTKAAVVKAIQEETGLTQDEILEEVNCKVHPQS